MRFLAALLFWLVTTAALAVAVPATWAQHNVVDEAGYVSLARQAATERPLQDAMASVLTNQLVDLGANTGYDISPNLLRGAATGYTRSSAFPGQYGTANRILHRWMFTDTVAQTDESGRADVDLSPMLADTSFQQTLQDFGIQPPSTLSVPLTENASDSLRPGRLRQLATWGPWVSLGSAVVDGCLRAAHHRCCQEARKSARGAGCFGTAGRCNRVGRHRGVARQDQPGARRHHR